MTLTQQISSAFASADAAHARSQQLRPGLSELRKCVRSFAWKLAGVERDSELIVDEIELRARYARAAMIGTWTHAGLLPFVAGLYVDAVDELGCTFEGIDGTTDVYARSAALVLDLKTCSQWAYERVLTHGARDEHVDQLHGYAGALRDAGFPVERLAIVYVNRSSAELTVIELVVDEQRIEQLRAWIAEANDYARRIIDDNAYVDNPCYDLHDVPRGEKRRGPGHDMECDGCPFRQRCWGETKPPQGELILDGSISVDAALQLYHDAQQREKGAKDDKSWARDMLSVVEPGTYSTHKLSRSADRVQMYPRKVDELLTLAAERGIPEWDVAYEGKVSGSVRVTPVKVVKR